MPPHDHGRAFRPSTMADKALQALDACQRPGSVPASSPHGATVEWWCREIIAGRLRAEAMFNAQLGEEKGRQVAINELMGQITFYRQRQDNRSLDEQQREVARAMVPILEEMLAHKLAPPQLMDTKTHSPAAKTTSAGAVVTSAEQRRALEVFDQGLHKAVLQHPRARTMD